MTGVFFSKSFNVATRQANLTYAVQSDLLVHLFPHMWAHLRACLTKTFP